MFKNPRFVILYSGQLVSTFGDSIFTTGLLWYVLTITKSHLDLTLAGLAQSLPALIGLVAGVFVDRWHKRLTMILSDGLRAAILFALLGISLAPHPQFVFILILITLLNGVGTFFRPAQLALLPKIVTKEQLTQANGINQSGSYLVRLAGTMSGGTILAFLGAPLVFLIDGVSFIASMVSLGFVRVAEDTVRPEGRSLFREWREGFMIIKDSPVILRLNVSSILANFTLGALTVIMTVWVRDGLHTSAVGLSVVNAGELVGVVLSGMTAGWFTTKFGPGKILVAGDVLAGLAIAGVVAFPNLAWTSLCMFVSGFSIGTVNVVLTSLMLQIVPETARGRVFGAYGAMNRLTPPLGIAVFGDLMLHWNLIWLFLVMGVFPCLAGLTFAASGTQRALKEGTTVEC